MKPTTKEAIELVVYFVSLLILGLVVAVALGYLDNPLNSSPKATPPQLVQVECYQKTNRDEPDQKSVFSFFWSDGTITAKENAYRCPDSMYRFNG